VQREPPALALDVLPERFAVVRLAADAAVPAWARGGSLVSVTRTADELSIVCPEAAVPAGLPAQRDFRGLRVRGPLDFSAVGVLASLAGPLAAAGVSLFALSTYDTDYLLVRAADLERALAALAGAGHTAPAAEL
jgi:uncharacterized protein